VVDLAAMRNAMADLGGDPSLINPQLPVELVIDHSVQVDEYATRARSSATRSSSSSATASATRSCAGAGGVRQLQGRAAEHGIVHQVNLEFLARVVETRDGKTFPDTLVGTDSHTTMVNGLGVLGWGVGGIEARRRCSASRSRC
jgi:aconitate hydratase